MGLENYSRIRKLGKGSFGEVFLVHDRRNNHQYVMKEVDLAQFGPKGRKEALKEVAFLNAMHHPYIVAYREFFEQENSAIGRKMLYIVMEFADGGDLDARIKAQNGRYFAESVILEWFVQICLAVKHIHDRKIIHRDLKSENCFLATEKSEKGKKFTIKVGDFGISKSMAHTAAQAMTRIGTPYYLSPEICMNKPYNMKSDIWSLGVILYELMSLKHPFDATSMEGLLNKIVKSQPAPLPKTYSIELRTVVDSMLSKQPSKRPTVNSLLKLPFLAPYVQKLLSPAQLADEFSHTVIHSDASARPVHNHAPPMPNPNHIAQKPNFNGARAKAQQQQQQQQLPPPSAHHHQHPPSSRDGYYEQKETVRGSPTPSAMRPPSSGHRQPPQSDRSEFPSLYPAPQHAPSAAPSSYANMSNADKIRAIREKREAELRELKQRQIEEQQLASRRRHEEKSNDDERAMRLREQAKERQMAEARYQQESAMPAAIRAPRGIPSVTRARDDGMGAAPLHGVPYQDRNPSHPPATRLQHQQLAEAARKQREEEITRMRINYFKERKLKRETKLRELDPYQQQPSAAPSSYGRAVAAPPIHPSYMPRQQQSNQYVSRPHSGERQSYAPLPQPTFVPQRRPLLQQPSIHPGQQSRNDVPPRWR